MNITIPTQFYDPKYKLKFEDYLNRNQFIFQAIPSNIRKPKAGEIDYIITIEEPMNAFWIGCNLIGITNDLL